MKYRLINKLDFRFKITWLIFSIIGIIIANLIVQLWFYKPQKNENEVEKRISLITDVTATTSIIITGIWLYVQFNQSNRQMNGESFYNLFAYVYNHPDISFIVREILDNETIRYRKMFLDQNINIQQAIVSYFEASGMVAKKSSIRYDYATDYGRTTIYVYYRLTKRIRDYRKHVYGETANEFFDWLAEKSKIELKYLNEEKYNSLNNLLNYLEGIE